ncbi:MAG: fumarylacetoacetate hydrolase family protein, partial [Bryobacteraceae bacterium]
MHLGQIYWNHAVTAAIFDGELARPIPDYTMYDLIRRSDQDGVSLTALAARLAIVHAERAEPLIPIRPKEVWACGCTYETSASFRDAEHGTREGFYAQVYRGERPEIFFKGTARVCVGPGQSIG